MGSLLEFLGRWDVEVWGVYVYRYAVRVLGGGVLLEFAGWGRC